MEGEGGAWKHGVTGINKVLVDGGVWEGGVIVITH